MGWFLFIFGFLFYCASNLQKTDFLILLPSYIIMIWGTGLLLLAEWRRNNNPQKKVSIFAILCFIFGFIVLELSNTWLTFISLVLSTVFGIVFRIENKKEEGRLVGDSLFLIGVILSGIILFCILLPIIFKPR